MKKDIPLESKNFKKEIDDYISPSSYYSGMDRHRVLERIEQSKQRKKWFGKPLLTLSFLMFLLIGGTILGLFMNYPETDNRLAAEDLIEVLQLGTSEEAIVRELGGGFVPVQTSDESVAAVIDSYRLDFPVEPGYLFEEQMDFLDTREVVEGRMMMQLMVSYQEGKLVSYDLIYKNSEGETIFRRVSDKGLVVDVVD
ncbi:hypothetical protein [Sutcliffiella deserti]|uniref:hypothetical protein n=1 Tax=Sutcliffiella deserti TaxID=2875501 RepID=UPI001CC1400F|nr:hypothetical protein [Sutcliffiella deserti]